VLLLPHPPTSNAQFAQCSDRHAVTTAPATDRYFGEFGRSAAL
jgi:hypothetical protein